MSKTKTITIKPEVTLGNPEDFFKDMIDDGISVREALMTIMEDELVHAELNRDHSDYDVRDDGWQIEHASGYGSIYTIKLIKRDDEDDDASDDMTLIASDADRAEA